MDNEIDWAKAAEEMTDCSVMEFGLDQLRDMGAIHSWSSPGPDIYHIESVTGRRLIFTTALAAAFLSGGTAVAKLVTDTFRYK